MEQRSAGPAEVGIIDPEQDPVEHFRANLALGSGDVWAVWLPEHPKTMGEHPRPDHAVLVCITGNGPASEANARFIAECFSTPVAARLGEPEITMSDQTQQEAPTTDLCGENGCDGRWRCAVCGRARPTGARKPSTVCYVTSDGPHYDEVDEVLPDREELGRLIWECYPGRMLSRSACLKTADAIHSRFMEKVAP